MRLPKEENQAILEQLNFTPLFILIVFSILYVSYVKEELEMKKWGIYFSFYIMYSCVGFYIFTIISKGYRLVKIAEKDNKGKLANIEKVEVTKEEIIREMGLLLVNKYLTS